MTKYPKQFKDARGIGCPYFEKNELRPFSHTIHKNSKWNTDLNGTAKTIKLLEENLEENPCHLGIGKDFLGKTLKA